MIEDKLVVCQKATENDLICRGMEYEIENHQTPYQHYRFLKSSSLGVCVIIDGDLQSTELGCATYHEAIVHPAMLLHSNPQNILICGGGEGAIIKEVFKYSNVKQAVMVDIDQQFIEACKRIIPSWSDGAFEDNRLDLVIDDIFHYIEINQDNPPQFDIIIGDLTDITEEIAPGKSFHSAAFYDSLKRLLKPGGLLITQASALSLYSYETHNFIRKSLSQVFNHVYSYKVQIDSFFVPWSFILCSQSNLPPVKEIVPIFENQIHNQKIDLVHFDAPSFGACFCLTKRIRELLYKT
jgi:spermidine synthase